MSGRLLLLCTIRKLEIIKEAGQILFNILRSKVGQCTYHCIYDTVSQKTGNCFDLAVSLANFSKFTHIQSRDQGSYVPNLLRKQIVLIFFRCFSFLSFINVVPHNVTNVITVVYKNISIQPQKSHFYFSPHSMVPLFTQAHAMAS